MISNDILMTIKMLSKGIIGGLNILGIKATYEPSRGIFIHGKKISGSASAVKRGIFFHHGTLLISSNLTVLSEVLNVSEGRKKRGVRSVPQIVTNLEAELGRKISFLEAKEALKKGFEKAYRIRFTRGELNEEEVLQAQRLLMKKYALEKLQP